MPKASTVAKRAPKPAAKRAKPSSHPARPMGAIVRARIDNRLKAEAEVVLQAIGLDTSTAFRLMMTRIAIEKALPFELHRPNPVTLAAIRELQAGKAPKFDSIEALMANLDADD